MSDIMFNADSVVIEGHNIKAQIWDLMIDSPDRRINNTGVRRAIVHGFGDKLVINYDKDYPNGVQIDGKLVVDSIYVKGKAGFAAGITSPSITCGAPNPPQDILPGGIPSGGAEYGLDLLGALNSCQEDIKNLKNEIDVLKQKVATLEAAHP